MLFGYWNDSNYDVLTATPFQISMQYSSRANSSLFKNKPYNHNESKCDRKHVQVGGGTWHTLWWLLATRENSNTRKNSKRTKLYFQVVVFFFVFFFCVSLNLWTTTVNLKADCTNEQIIGLHSTYHCGAGKCANTLKDPFSTLKKFGFQKKKKKKKKCVGESKLLGFLFSWALYRKQKSPNTRPVAR